MNFKILLDVIHLLIANKEPWKFLRLMRKGVRVVGVEEVGAEGLTLLMRE